MRERDDWLVRLKQDGLLREDAATLRTTRRWQAAMARAALRLFVAGDQRDDLRIPIAAALIEIYGDGLDDQAIAEAVIAILPIEIGELAPRR